MSTSSWASRRLSTRSVGSVPTGVAHLSSPTTHKKTSPIEGPKQSKVNQCRRGIIATVSGYRSASFATPNTHKDDDVPVFAAAAAGAGAGSGGVGASPHLQVALIGPPPLPRHIPSRRTRAAAAGAGAAAPAAAAATEAEAAAATAAARKAQEAERRRGEARRALKPRERQRCREIHKESGVVFTHEVEKIEDMVATFGVYGRALDELPALLRRLKEEQEGEADAAGGVVVIAAAATDGEDELAATSAAVELRCETFERLMEELKLLTVRRLRASRDLDADSAEVEHTFNVMRGAHLAGVPPSVFTCLRAGSCGEAAALLSPHRRSNPPRNPPLPPPHPRRGAPRHSGSPRGRAEAAALPEQTVSLREVEQMFSRVQCTPEALFLEFGGALPKSAARKPGGEILLSAIQTSRSPYADCLGMKEVLQLAGLLHGPSLTFEELRRFVAEPVEALRQRPEGLQPLRQQIQAAERVRPFVATAVSYVLTIPGPSRDAAVAAAAAAAATPARKQTLQSFAHRKGTLGAPHAASVRKSLAGGSPALAAATAAEQQQHEEEAAAAAQREEEEDLLHQESVLRSLLSWLYYKEVKASGNEEAASALLAQADSVGAHALRHAFNALTPRSQGAAAAAAAPNANLRRQHLQRVGLASTLLLIQKGGFVPGGPAAGGNSGGGGGGNGVASATLAAAPSLPCSPRGSGAWAQARAAPARQEPPLPPTPTSPDGVPQNNAAFVDTFEPLLQRVASGSMLPCRGGEGAPGVAGAAGGGSGVWGAGGKRGTLLGRRMRFSMAVSIGTADGDEDEEGGGCSGGGGGGGGGDLFDSAREVRRSLDEQHHAPTAYNLLAPDAMGSQQRVFLPAGISLSAAGAASSAAQDGTHRSSSSIDVAGNGGSVSEVAAAGTHAAEAAAAAGIARSSGSGSVAGGGGGGNLSGARRRWRAGVAGVGEASPPRMSVMSSSVFDTAASAEVGSVGGPRVPHFPKTTIARIAAELKQQLDLFALLKVQPDPAPAFSPASSSSSVAHTERFPQPPRTALWARRGAALRAATERSRAAMRGWRRPPPPPRRIRSGGGGGGCGPVSAPPGEGQRRSCGAGRGGGGVGAVMVEVADVSVGA